MQGAVDAKIGTNDKFLQIINTDKSIVYIYNDKYETAQIRIDGKIISGYINSNGDSVIEYTTSGNKTVLAIYNKRGVAKYNVKLSNSTIGQYILSEDSKKLAYVEVNINGISATSSLYLVEFKNSETELKAKNVALEENSLIYEIEFVGNNILYRTDKKIVKLNLNNQNIKATNFEFDEIISLDLDLNKYSYVKFENGKYLLGINSVGGKNKKEIEIGDIPKNYVYSNGKIYVSYQKEMAIYNDLKMKIKEYKSDMVITKPVIIGNGNDVAFLVSNKLIIFTI